MTRLVRLVDGSVVLDASGRAPGRGTYVCDQASCLEPQRLLEGVRRALGATITPELLAEATRAAT
jgi:predicted RNA-binding protein YlxR (DUF448 family)